jgi:hypothetical protein
MAHGGHEFCHCGLSAKNKQGDYEKINELGNVNIWTTLPDLRLDPERGDMKDAADIHDIFFGADNVYDCYRAF